MRSKLIKSEVVKLFNTTKETLRYYEKEGLLHPEVGDKNYRFYDLEEIRTLRQLFMFRDLGLSIEEIKNLMNGQDSFDYRKVMDLHLKSLRDKIEHYRIIEKEVSQVLDLLDKGIHSMSFNSRTFKKRKYLMFNPFETAFVDSLKTYYDSFQFFIESDYYTEKSMITSYDYESLSDFNREDVLMGIEVNRSFDKELNLKDVQVVELNKGKYLSIYYIFREGKFDELKDLKKKIDEYLDENQLKVDSKIVLEIERPEFSLILDENSMLYEIQIKVRKAFHE